MSGTTPAPNGSSGKRKNDLRGNVDSEGDLSPSSGGFHGFNADMSPIPVQQQNLSPETPSAGVAFSKEQNSNQSKTPSHQQRSPSFFSPMSDIGSTPLPVGHGLSPDSESVAPTEFSIDMLAHMHSNSFSKDIPRQFGNAAERPEDYAAFQNEVI